MNFKNAAGQDRTDQQHSCSDGMPRRGHLGTSYHSSLLAVANFQRVERDEDKGPSRALFPISLAPFHTDGSVYLTVIVVASSALFFYAEAHPHREVGMGRQVLAVVPELWSLH